MYSMLAKRFWSWSVLKRHLLWRFCVEVEKVGVAARAEAGEMSELDPHRRPLLRKAEKAQKQAKLWV